MGVHSRALFFALWGSQLFSLLGSDVASFALRVWTYKSTRSVKSFSLITFFSEGTACLVSPLAGAIVDRHSRKKLLVISDAVNALATLALCVLYWYDLLLPWHIYLCSIVTSLMGAVQWPAFKATVSLVVPREDLVRYGGMNQAAPALSMLLSPLAAGLVVEKFGLEGAFLLEFSTALAALAVVGASALPSPAPGGGNADSSKRKTSLLRETKEAADFLGKRPGLSILLGLLASGHLTSGAIRLLMTPVLLNMGGTAMLGSVLSVAGTGALAGSAALAVWGGPKRQSQAILKCIAIQGALIALIGVVRRPEMVLGLAALYMFFIPFNRACRDSIWQRKTPADMQGRIFGLQRLVAESSAPVAAVLAGPLTEIFENRMVTGGTWDGTRIGKIIGVGAGRGAAALFFILGLGNIMVAALGASSAHLLNIESELPDVSAETSKKES